MGAESGGTLLIAQVAVNFTPALLQQFPREVLRQATTRYGVVDQDMTVIQWEGDRQARPRQSAYLLLNADFIAPAKGLTLSPKPPPPGRVIWQTPHPLSHRLYQYEGLKPADRAVLRNTDISMRLLYDPDGLSTNR